jgi:hypothetical protein
LQAAWSMAWSYWYPYLPKKPFKNKAIIDKDIRRLPLPLHGRFLVLKVAFAPAGTDLDSGRFPPNERILGRIKKSKGEEVILLLGEPPVSLVLGQRFLKYRSEIQIHFRKDDIDKADLLDTTRAFSISVPKFAHEIPAIYDLSLGWENVSPDPSGV